MVSHKAEQARVSSQGSHRVFHASLLVRDVDGQVEGIPQNDKETPQLLSRNSSDCLLSFRFLCRSPG